MLSQGSWDTLIASIQADLGSLLQARQRLLRWQTIAPASVQPTIQRLLGDQASLEAQAPGAIQAASGLTAAGIGLDMITAAGIAGAFLYRMEAHLARVNALARQLGESGFPTAPESISWGPILAAGAAGLVILWLLRRKR